MNKTSVLLLASILTFSSYANAEWAYFSNNKAGDHYIDYDRIVKGDGYIYFWALINHLRPSAQNELRALSSIVYHKVDCKTPRKLMYLQFLRYGQYYGKGTVTGRSTLGKKWRYPEPGTLRELYVDHVCSL